MMIANARVVGVDGGAVAILQPWLDVRACRDHEALRTVFCTASGQRLTTSYVRRRMSTLRRGIGLAKGIYAHSLRFTLAAQFRVEGADIGVISKQLSHASIQTTTHYLDHIEWWTLVDQIAMRNRYWASRRVRQPCRCRADSLRLQHGTVLVG